MLDEACQHWGDGKWPSISQIYSSVGLALKFCRIVLAPRWQLWPRNGLSSKGVGISATGREYAYGPRHEAAIRFRRDRRPLIAPPIMGVPGQLL